MSFREDDPAPNQRPNIVDKDAQLEAKLNDKQIEALENELINKKAEYSQGLKEIRPLRLSKRIKDKMKLIDKRKSALFQNIEELKTLLDKKNMKMDENVEATKQTIVTEINEIKSRIIFFKELEEQLKICMKEDTQLWKDKLNDAMNSKLKTYQEMQRNQDAMKRSHDRRVQLMNEIEAEEIADMEKEAEILQTEYNELDKKVQAKQRIQANRNNQIRAGIQHLQRTEAQLDTEVMLHHICATLGYTTPTLEFARLALGHAARVASCLPQHAQDAQPSTSAPALLKRSEAHSHVDRMDVNQEAAENTTEDI